MNTKSVTPAAPVTRPKSHINDTLTWVKDWHVPLEYAGGVTPSFQVKGWYKAPETERSRPNVNTSGVYNLENCKYLDEPPVVETEDVKPVEQQNGQEENGHKQDDLRLAFSMDKKDDQISSLSGLGM